MKFKCEVCKKEQYFNSEEEAFQEGWDTPANFSHGHITCCDCPSAPLVMNDIKNQKAQEN